MSYSDIQKAFQSKQPVYLKSDYEDIAFYWNPEDPLFVTLKPKGRKEYKVAHSSKLANDIIIEGNEITPDEYKRY